MMEAVSAKRCVSMPTRCNTDGSLQVNTFMTNPHMFQTFGCIKWSNRVVCGHAHVISRHRSTMRDSDSSDS